MERTVPVLVSRDDLGNRVGFAAILRALLWKYQTPAKNLRLHIVYTPIPEDSDLDALFGFWRDLARREIVERFALPNLIQSV